MTFGDAAALSAQCNRSIQTQLMPLSMASNRPLAKADWADKTDLSGPSIHDHSGSTAELNDARTNLTLMK